MKVQEYYWEVIVNPLKISHRVGFQVPNCSTTGGEGGGLWFYFDSGFES